MKARRMLNGIPDRVLIGVGGLVGAIGFVTAPTLLAWWIRLFI